MTHLLLRPPGGVFVLAGVVHILAYAFDYIIYFFDLGYSGIIIGWGPIHQLSDVVRFLAPGAGLIMTGAIIFHLARISTRVRVLAEASEGSR